MVVVYMMVYMNLISYPFPLPRRHTRPAQTCLLSLSSPVPLGISHSVLKIRIIVYLVCTWILYPKGGCRMSSPPIHPMLDEFDFAYNSLALWYPSLGLT